MTYNVGSLKWGDPTLGASSGEVVWSMDIPDGSYFASGYSPSDFEDALQAAFDRWEAVADIDFTYSASSGVDIDVSMGALNGSTVGQASYGFFNNPSGISTFTSANITMDSTAITWTPYGGGGVSFYAVALHEIGHAIGFGHVNDVTEIMNPYISTDDLGDGDISGAQVLYGEGGAPPPPPPDGPTGPPADPGGGITSDGGGGGGGAIGILAGVFALLFGLVFGGPAALVAAAASRGDDEEEPEVSDEVFTEVHSLYADEESWLASDEYASHSHGKSCGHDYDCDCAENDEDEGMEVAVKSCGHAFDCGCELQQTDQDEVILLTDLLPVCAGPSSIGLDAEMALAKFDEEEAEEEVLVPL